MSTTATEHRAPEPNQTQAQRHLTLLDEEAEQFTFATFTDSKKHKPRPDPLARILHGALEQHWQTLVELNRRGAGIFVVVNETDGHGARNENIVRIRAVWQEADRGDEPALPVEPHILIESSPGKYHRYILVDGMPLDVFEPVQQRLVDDYGSDPNAKDRRRVLRLAGFYHLKNPAAPHLVRIVETSQTPPLDWQKLRPVLPPVEAPHRITNVVALPAAGTPLMNPADIASALTVLNPDMGYMDWLKVGMALHSTGAGRQAFDLWEQWSQRGNLYKPGECVYRWGTFNRERPNPITLRTFFWMAHQAGWDGELSTDPLVLPLIDVQRRRVLGRFAEQHGVVMINGKALIAYREHDRNSQSMTTRFCGRGDISMRYENEKLPLVAQDNKGRPYIRYEPLVAIWMKSKIRKTYDQVIFEPISGQVSGATRLPDGNVLNLYQGLTVAPKEGDCSPILDHIRNVWCSNDAGAYNYVLDWLARMVQRPFERGHTVIVLRSGEGTGKNIIIDVLVKAFGEHAFVASKNEEITGRFNDQLATSVLVFANEAIWGGDKQQEGALKSLITDETLTIEKKYLPHFRVRNCCHLIMASNSDWVAPVGLDDRRFVILDVNEDKKADHGYFTKLAANIANGGLPAFLHNLKHRDIAEFNPRILPDLGTRQITKLEAKINTADTFTQFWVACLYEGTIIAELEVEEQHGGYSNIVRRRNTVAPRWDEGQIEVRREHLREAYTQWACKNQRRHIAHDTTVGRKLKVLAGAQTRQRKLPDGSRPRIYVFDSLETCRRRFEEHIKQPVDWADSGADVG